MKISSNLLAKQLLLTLLQSLMLSVLTLQLFIHFIEASHQQKAQVLEELVAHPVSNDPKLLARQLRNAFEFQSLAINTLDGDKVFANVESNDDTHLSTALLKSYDALPIYGEITNDDLNLKLRFAFDLNMESGFVDRLLLLIWSVSFGLLALNYLVVRLYVRHICKKASTKIAHAIAGFAASQSSSDNPDLNLIPAQFSEVAQALKTLDADEQNGAGELNDNITSSAVNAKQDELTGLPSRNRFVQYFEEHLIEGKSPSSGCLAIIRCTELQEINHTRGYHEGDKYVIEIVDIINKCSSNYYSRKLYRLNGSDLALVLPSQSLKEGERFGQNLQTKFNEYQQLSEIDSVAYTGIVYYKPGKPLGEYLAMADTAISIAQTRQPNAWHAQQETDLSEQVGASYGTQNWRQVIDEVLNHKRVALLHQTLQSCGSKPGYAEILTRFKTAQGQILPTASFLAMAEKLDKIVDVDKMIIEYSINMLAQLPPSEQCYGINITAKSAHDEKFVNFLERQLKQQPSLSSQLVFEVSEQGLQQNIKASKRFIDMLHNCKAKITVERFGVGLTSFKFFRDLKPDNIKMDGSYTRGIDEDQNNQYFMRLMIDLAHRIDIGVFAEGIETEAEKLTLEQLDIDGVQGYFIGNPQPFVTTQGD